eukprot:56080-Eustigmatos_ZCMA.PRE.2
MHSTLTQTTGLENLCRRLDSDGIRQPVEDLRTTCPIKPLARLPEEAGDGELQLKQSMSAVMRTGCCSSRTSEALEARAHWASCPETAYQARVVVRNSQHICKLFHTYSDQLSAIFFTVYARAERVAIQETLHGPESLHHRHVRGFICACTVTSKFTTLKVPEPYAAKSAHALGWLPREQFHCWAAPC